MVGKALVVLAVLGTAGVVSAAGQAPTVRAYLDRTQVPLNQAFSLSVEIEGGNTSSPIDPQLPDMTDFSRYLGSSSSQQIQIVNGQTSMTRTIQYRFQATREGTHQIGAVRVTVGGVERRSGPLQIEVLAAGAAPPPTQSNNAAPNSASLSDEDLFLVARANKNSVYQNEPVIVEFKIYTRVQINSFSITQPANTPGFWVEEYPLPNSPQTGVEIVDGRRYTVATLRKVALFPTSAGRKTIDPMSIEAQVRVSRRSIDPFDDFFSSSSLFGRVVPHLVTSEPLTVEVTSLPAANAPDDFSGLVGSASINATVDKRQVETDEPVTLSVRIAATGNVQSIPDPEVDFPADFEVYPPEKSEQLDRGDVNVSGTKTYDYLIVPRGPGERVIPSIALSYFDATSGSYRTVSTDPITVNVTGDAIAGSAGSGRGRSSIRTLREDIRFIHTQNVDLRPMRDGGLGPAFWVITFIPLIVLGGAYVTRRHRDRLEGDVAYARKRRASRSAKRRFAAARARMDPTTQQDFYAETGKALLGFLGDHLNVAEAGVVRDDLREQMRHHSVSGGSIDEYFACLDVCDRQRFSPSASDPKAMREFLSRAERAMSELERELNR